MIDLDRIVYSESSPVSDEELNALLNGEPNAAPRAYQPVLCRSLVYIVARYEGLLVGFANVATDGGVHAFLVDPTVRADLRHQGVGTTLVRLAADAARRRGADWLHVDFENTYESFYRKAGFRPTGAGLIRLDGSEPSLVDAPAAPARPALRSTTTESPFHRLGAFGLIVQSLLVGGIGAAIGHRFAPTGSQAVAPVAMALFYVGMAVVLVVRARVAQLDVPRLFGPRPTTRTLRLALVAFPLVCFSIAGIWVLFLPISFFAPEFVHHWLERAKDVVPPQTPGLWLAHALVAVVAAPVVEEVFFRGVLMHRWALRWGTLPAVIASSALFAICHFELLGHFVFAVAMCALYLRTRSLWVPIAAHALNNLIASVASIGEVLRPGRVSKPLTVATMQSGWVAGGVALIVGVLLLAVYYRRLWERAPLKEVLRGPVPYTG